jgi:hypothetical protein
MSTTRSELLLDKNGKPYTSISTLILDKNDPNYGKFVEVMKLDENDKVINVEKE